MAVKHKNIFLYLTLVCFLGLILIFIFDGYMGVYDTINVTAGEYPQKIEPDFWLQPYNQASANVEWGGKVFFRYEVDNRQFSAYNTDIDVSVWHSQEKVRDLISQPLSLASFNKGSIDWVVDIAQLLPAEAPPEQGYQFTVIINRGGIERKVIIYTNPSYIPKPIIAPPIR